MRGLSLLRGNRPILDGIDLRLEAGQSLAWWALGAGKTPSCGCWLVWKCPALAIDLFGAVRTIFALINSSADVRWCRRTLRCWARYRCCTTLASCSTAVAF